MKTLEHAVTWLGLQPSAGPECGIAWRQCGQQGGGGTRLACFPTGPCSTTLVSEPRKHPQPRGHLGGQGPRDWRSEQGGDEGSPDLPAVGEVSVFIENTGLVRPGVAVTLILAGGRGLEVAGGSEHEAPAQRTGSGSSAPMRIVPRSPASPSREGSGRAAPSSACGGSCSQGPRPMGPALRDPHLQF